MTLNSFVSAEVTNQKIDLINHIIINVFPGKFFHPRSKLEGYLTEVKNSG